MASETAIPDVVVKAPVSKQRRAAAAGAIGTILEWYDYGLYGTAAALVLSPLFFPDLGGAAQLAAFATFAVGFFVRPLGGIVLGFVGDRFGRKTVLIFTVILMGVTTAMMGLLPTYEAIGVWAPIMLVILRLLQGFGAGAELASALTYVAESTERPKRAFYASFSTASSIGGIFLSTGVFALVAAVVGSEQLLAWGWRIPFLGSIVLVIVALILRSRLEDSPEFVKVRTSETKVRRPWPLIDMLRNDPRSFFAGLFAPTGLSVVSYVVTVFGASYAVNTLKMDPSLVLVMILTATGVGMLAVPLFGKLSDRVGSRKVFLGGTIFCAVYAFPYFLLLNSGVPALIIGASALYYAAGVAPSAGAQGEFLPSLFGARYRVTGVATSRELSSALFAGPAPFIATALVALAGGTPWFVAIYVVIIMAISVCGVALGWRANSSRQMAIDSESVGKDSAR